LKITVDNDSKLDAGVSVTTQIFEIDDKTGHPIIAPVEMQIISNQSATIETEGIIPDPKLWGTGPFWTPNRTASTTITTSVRWVLP
jgi:hypothetical protein